MATTSPRDLYQQLAVNLRSRLDFAQHVLAHPFPHHAQTVETVALQGRKCVETIAYMMLVATEHRFGRANMPREVRMHWNAETIFVRLRKKGLDLIPSPERIRKSDDPRFKLIVEGIPEYRLSYDELIDIYQTFHSGLHEPNPYVQGADDAHYLALLPRLQASIEKIKNLTWCHMVFIHGHAFLCVLSDDNGRVGVTGLDKIAGLPSDLSE